MCLEVPASSVNLACHPGSWSPRFEFVCETNQAKGVHRTRAEGPAWEAEHSHPARAYRGVQEYIVYHQRKERSWKGCQRHHRPTKHPSREPLVGTWDLTIRFLDSPGISTFLPQDRVAEFARMTPQNLLKETQRAAGNENLTTWHEALIKSGKELKELEGVRTCLDFGHPSYTS